MLREVRNLRGRTPVEAMTEAFGIIIYASEHVNVCLDVNFGRGKLRLDGTSSTYTNGIGKDDEGKVGVGSKMSTITTTRITLPYKRSASTPFSSFVNSKSFTY